MKTVALINPASGGVTADGADRMRTALEAAGVRGAEIVEIDLSGCAKQLTDIAALSPDLFVVWGGDGTLRAALTTVGQTTTNLLLLPGGTMNLLAKSIHGPETWDKILSSVLEGPKRKKLPAGKANDEIFFCAMLAGAPARFAEARESIRRGELVKAVAETRAAIETLQTLQLDARYRGGYNFGSGNLPPTSVIGVLVGPLAREHKMEIAALADPTTAAALNVVWSSFMSDWRSAPGIQIVPATSLVIDCEEGEDIPIIIDGEAMQAGARVRVDYIEEAAQCLTAA